MGDETRVIYTGLRKAAAGRRFLEVTRERGYWVLHNRITRSKRYYARPADILKLLRLNDGDRRA